MELIVLDEGEDAKASDIEDYGKYSLEELAEEINSGHQAIGEGLRRSAMEVVHNGARLVAAKSKLPHGEWLPWLAKNCPEISQQTASRYVQTYNKAQSNYALMSNLSPTEAYKALGIVKEDNPHVANNSGENEWYTPPVV